MHANMKLGRVRPTSKQRAMALRMKDYMTKPLPKAPDKCVNTTGAALGMWKNDEIGDCVLAMCANFRAIVAAKENLPPPPTTDEAVESQYFALTGGQDSGLNESDTLNVAMKGLELGGDPWQVAVWVSVSLQDIEMCKSLISLFYSLFLGVELPTDAQNQTVWAPTPGRGGAPGGWGGHAILWANYYNNDRNGLVTWGAEKLCTTSWLEEYGDEAHVILTADRAKEQGIDWNALVADMQLAAQE